MKRYICIHGHFYQPPRENPWIEAIDLQDSAHPYHDWNRRITAECYAPNAKSRILDDQGRIVQIVNNYAKISFNFGPTLLAWLEVDVPSVYKAILEADRQSMENFSGHGSALAQAYNHMIMPLANRRDKITQVRWGIRDFEYRFQRKPEGMWLPETAVDLETLDILADQGIRFTILAQHQAHRVRRTEEENWQDVSGGKIDPTRAYSLRLPSGRSMALFFYDGTISRAVAFEKLLNSGVSFSQRILGGFSEKRSWPQLVHIATDGESYGHHHRFGDMALAYALHTIEAENLARLTNYGQYLEMHSPTHEVEIFENTSWSCAHGVERWRNHCGCSTGANPKWNQNWRKPLREALDFLRDAIAPDFEETARRFLKDPWEARNRYIDAILDRSTESLDAFLTQQGVREWTPSDRQTVLKLLELQHHTLLMYTSCGWFFDDLSGIETIQILQYAGRVLQLYRKIFDHDLKPRFLEILEQAQSNIPIHGNGRHIYKSFVEEAMADLNKVAAHYAISSLFKDYEKHCSIYCYMIDREEYQVSENGKARLLLGRARFTSQITMESALLCFGVLHLGDHNMTCGVREYRSEKDFRNLMEKLPDIFKDEDIPETIRRLDQQFGPSIYSLRSLFRDEQRRIFGLILEPALDEAEAAYRQLFEYHTPMIRFLEDSRSPLPRALSMAAEFVLDADLKRAVTQQPLEPDKIRALLEQAELSGSPLEKETLEYGFRKTLEDMADKLAQNPTNLPVLEILDSALSLLRDLPFQVNLWTLQNFCYHILQSTYPGQLKSADQGDENGKRWLRIFSSLAQKLSLKIP